LWGAADLLTVGRDAAPRHTLDARADQLVKQCRVKGAVQGGVVVVVIVHGCERVGWGIEWGLRSCLDNDYRH